MYGGACPSQHVLLNVSLAFCRIRKISYPGHTIASHSHTQGAKIHNSKCTLSNKNIRSFVSDQVQSVVYEDMRCWVNQRTFQPNLAPRERNMRAHFRCPTCVAFNEGIVALAISILFNLLDVGSPVNFSVYSRHQLHASRAGQKSFLLLAQKLGDQSSQGIFQMIRAQRMASVRRRRGESHLVCLGLLARSMAWW